MSNQRQVDEYVPVAYTPTRFMKPELSRRLKTFVTTGIGLVSGCFLAQALPGTHHWNTAFEGSIFEVTALICVWNALRSDDTGTTISTRLLRFLRLRRLE